jgi:hypothetical protein
VSAFLPFLFVPASFDAARLLSSLTVDDANALPQDLLRAHQTRVRFVSFLSLLPLPPPLTSSSHSATLSSPASSPHPNSFSSASFLLSTSSSAPRTSRTLLCPPSLSPISTATTTRRQNDGTAQTGRTTRRRQNKMKLTMEAKEWCVLLPPFSVVSLLEVASLMDIARIAQARPTLERPLHRTGEAGASTVLFFSPAHLAKRSSADQSRC